MCIESTLAVHPETLSSMILLLDVIVVALEERVPVCGDRKQALHELTRTLNHVEATHLGVLDGPSVILEVRATFFAGGLEVGQPTPDNGSLEVVISDRLTDGPGTAVEHEPQALFFITLEFQEVIASA